MIRRPKTGAVLATVAAGVIAVAAPAVAATGHGKGVLPIRHLTPGSYYPTRDAHLICAPSYKIAPVAEVASKKVFARYKISWKLHKRYELDHLVPVGLGGNNSVANLWPQALAGRTGAYVKDSNEATLRIMVCSGRISLPAAQHAIAVDWPSAVNTFLAKPIPQQVPAPAPTATVTVTVTVTVTPTHPAPTPTATFSGPTWGDGSHTVGSDIPPGMYAAAGGGDCYWERDNAAGGILGNGLHQALAVVTIAATDKTFKSNACGLWHAYHAPSAPAGAFADGTHLVNSDILPGTYSSPGGQYCYWERDKDLGGGPGSNIANDFNVLSPVVQVLPSDVGFRTSSCGNWVRTGD